MNRNEVSIVRMSLDMLDGICAVEQSSFAVPWSRRAFEGELVNKCSYYVAAVQDGSVIGYAGMHIAADEGDITNIAVLPERRRRGVAQKLIDALTDECVRRGAVVLHLDVRESNTPARALYEKNGFVTDGMRKNYYSDTREPAVLMSKKIL